MASRRSLAMAELTTVLASLFGPGGIQMQLFDTDASDVTLIHDLMVPMPRLDSKGVRVTVL
jgi:hypothetical protein